MIARFPTPSDAYELIAEVIRYLDTHHQRHPNLATIAQHVGKSPSHLQRIFTDWAGVSPKQFLSSLTLEHAKTLLREHNASLLEATLSSGLSSSSRLHDLFVTIEGMTPGEYKQGGLGLSLSYSFYDTLFGPVLIANTKRGICFLAFSDDYAETLQELFARFPKAHLHESPDPLHEQALQFFRADWTDLPRLKLHLRGTPFQLHVWNALLRIPPGKVATYGSIAQQISHPNAQRAVGTAIGQNPISFLIPCHRVIQASGSWGSYHWGSARKRALLGWESAQTSQGKIK